MAALGRRSARSSTRKKSSSVVGAVLNVDEKEVLLNAPSQHHASQHLLHGSSPRGLPEDEDHAKEVVAQTSTISAATTSSGPEEDHAQALDESKDDTGVTRNSQGPRGREQSDRFDSFTSWEAEQVQAVLV